MPMCSHLLTVLAYLAYIYIIAPFTSCYNSFLGQKGEGAALYPLSKLGYQEQKWSMAKRRSTTKPTSAPSQFWKHQEKDKSLIEA